MAVLVILVYTTTHASITINNNNADYSPIMPTHLSATAKQQLDALLHSYPGDGRAKASHPGTVVGVINHQGKIIYLEATGPSTVNQPNLLRSDTVREQRLIPSPT